MHCAGFNSDTYDRYVLGLLEEPDRSQLETQIQEQCPACLAGVQRSMNLWLVFAETLENAEPSEDFRGRIVRIAELSRKVLTFPKDSAVRERSSVPISALGIMCAVTCILLVATWYAGRASVRIDHAPSTAEMERMARSLADSQIKYEQDNDKHAKPGNESGSSTRTTSSRTKQLEDALAKSEDARLKSQAEATQYKAANDRSKEQTSETTDLLNTFTRAGARLLPMKATEAAGKGLGYALFAQKFRLVFVGSNLPKPSQDHTFQLWILRNESPTEVSAGVFTPSENGQSVVLYEDVSLLSNVTSVLVTEESIQGDYTKPTGPRLFEVSTAEENRAAVAASN
jgi:anti-sigma-K factor RskA